MCSLLLGFSTVASINQHISRGVLFLQDSILWNNKTSTSKNTGKTSYFPKVLFTSKYFFILCRSVLLIFLNPLTLSAHQYLDLSHTHTHRQSSLCVCFISGINPSLLFLWKLLFCLWWWYCTCTPPPHFYSLSLSLCSLQLGGHTQKTALCIFILRETCSFCLWSPINGCLVCDRPTHPKLWICCRSTWTRLFRTLNLKTKDQAGGGCLWLSNFMLKRHQKQLQRHPRQFRLVGRGHFWAHRLRWLCLAVSSSSI